MVVGPAEAVFVDVTVVLGTGRGLSTGVEGGVGGTIFAFVLAPPAPGVSFFTVVGGTAAVPVDAEAGLEGAGAGIGAVVEVVEGVLALVDEVLEVLDVVAEVVAGAGLEVVDVEVVGAEEVVVVVEVVAGEGINLTLVVSESVFFFRFIQSNLLLVSPLTE